MQLAAVFMLINSVLDAIENIPLIPLKKMSSGSDSGNRWWFYPWCPGKRTIL